MSTWWRWLGSLRLTLLGLLALVAVVVSSRVLNEFPDAWLVGVLAALAVNLLAAMLQRKRLRQRGLGLFHLGLFMLLLLLAWGRATVWHGRVAVTQGTPLDPSQVEVLKAGPWHGRPLEGVEFMQGRFSVAYAPGMQRRQTQSEVWVPDRGRQVVGDDVPLTLSGYRFYTTPNKGFAPLLEWNGPAGDHLLTAVNLDSFPVSAWDQTREWESPQGEVVQLALRVQGVLSEEASWVLAPEKMPSTLVVAYQGKRHELQPGEAMNVGNGQLRFVELRGWMGYRIFYDPSLVWLLLVSLLASAGLAWHAWERMGSLPGPVSAAAIDRALSGAGSDIRTSEKKVNQ